MTIVAIWIMSDIPDRSPTLRRPPGERLSAAAQRHTEWAINNRGGSGRQQWFISPHTRSQKRSFTVGVLEPGWAKAIPPVWWAAWKTTYCELVIYVLGQAIGIGSWEQS